MTKHSPKSVVRACLQAYVDKDRAAIEELIAEDYQFTSPLDHALDRATYFKRCWPNSEDAQGFEFIYQTDDEDDRTFVVYEASTIGGKNFRNCELHIVRDGKLIATEVYFGWDLPHPAPKGRFLDSK